MKSRNIVIIALIIALSTCSFIYYANYNSHAANLDFPLIQPYYRLLIDKASNKPNINEDLLLAILGTDERKNERSRSDVIMVIKYKPKENKVIVVSVPRDSKVSISGKGLTKVNAASAYGGSRLQVDVLENMFQVSNMRFIHINFEGFKKIIDSLGGLEVNAQKDFKRNWGERDTYATKGKNILMGDDMLEYVRFRHDSDGDFGRIKRQQEVLLSFYSKVTKPDNITLLPQIALSIAKNIDSDMNIFFIIKHTKALEKLDKLEFEFYTLKTTSEKSNAIWYEIIDEKDLEFISNLLQN